MKASPVPPNSPFASSRYHRLHPELRKLLEAVEKKAPVMREWKPGMTQTAPPEVAAPVADPNKPLDVRKIPFGVEIEMDNFSWDTLKGAMDLHGIPVTLFPKGAKKGSWDPHTSWSMDYDGSVSTKHLQGGELCSRIMTLDDGGVDEIRKVFQLMKECGGIGVQSAGFHVHVGIRDLGLPAKALVNLVKMELANENIIFRIAQNGQPMHRDDAHVDDPQGHTKKYCKPLSSANVFPLVHAGTHEQAMKGWYGAFPENRDFSTGREFQPGHRRHPSRNTGFNLNSYWYRGTIEFRIFNFSDNVEDYVTNVLFALHMVKYAAEKDFELEEVHPWSAEKDKPVQEDHLHRFLKDVVGEGKLKESLLNLFFSSGGQVTQEAPAPDTAKTMAKYLAERHYRFGTNGTELTASEAVEAVKKCGFPVEILSPWGKKVVLKNSQALNHYLAQQILIEGGGTLAPLAKQDPSIVSGLQVVTRLGEAGTRFYAPGGQEMAAGDGTRPYLALAGENPLLVMFPGETVPVEIKSLRELEVADQILRQDAGQLPRAQRELLESLSALHDRGVKFVREVGEEPTPVPCESMVTAVLRFGQDPMTALLPRRIWWSSPFKRRVPIRGAQDLHALSAKLAQSRFRSNLP